MTYRMIEDDLKFKIQSFRVSDLQSLVGFFGRSRNGKKSELQNRALEILKTRPSDVDIISYRTKINELYRIAQEETKQNHFDYANRSTTNPPPAPPPVSSRVIRNQYTPNPYAVPPQSSKPTSNNIMYQNGGIYNPNGYPNTTVYSGQVAPPATINPPPTIACNLGDSVRIISPPITHANVSFRLLPFYKIRHEILKPSILKLKVNGRNNNSQVFQMSFVLNCEIASDITLHRDYTKNEYPVQVQLRISAIDNTNLNNGQQSDDFLPLGLYIRMNDKLCSLPPCSPCTRPNTEARRVPLPINITQFMKLSPMNVNKLTINWLPEVGRTFVISINVVEKLSSLQLLEKLKGKPTITVDVTKQIIAKQYKRVIDDDDDENASADDDDIATTIVRVSLQCPLAKFRIMVPAKGKNCSHLQCFDGSAYISLNEKKSVWMCPVCNRSLLYDDLLIDQYFVDVLASELSSDCQEVQLFADGSWKIYDEENETENEKNKSKDSVPNSPSENLSLSSSGDNNADGLDQKTVIADVPPVGTDTSNATVPAAPVTDSFIDLTEEDDEVSTYTPAEEVSTNDADLQPDKVLPEANEEPASPHAVDLSHQSRSSTPISSLTLFSAPTSPTSAASSQSVIVSQEPDSIMTPKHNPMVMSRTPSPLSKADDDVAMMDDIESAITPPCGVSQNTETNVNHDVLPNESPDDAGSSVHDESTIEMLDDDPIADISASTVKASDKSFSDSIADQDDCTDKLSVSVEGSASTRENSNSSSSASDLINMNSTIISLMDDSPPPFIPYEALSSPPSAMAAMNLGKENCDQPPT